MSKLKKKENRAKRTRARVKLSGRPRLTVFRSNKYIYAQIIDDAKGKTLASFSSKRIKKADASGKSLVALAELVGQEIAVQAKKAKVKAISFDRGSFKYHGAVKALADGARKGGLEF